MVDDGHGGNGWIFRTSSLHLPFLSVCSSHLSSHIFSHLAVLSSPDIFRSYALYSAFLAPRRGAVQMKPNRGSLSTYNAVEYSGHTITEKVRHPAEMSSPPNAGFSLVFVLMVGFSIQWVHIWFHRALPLCQEKCLVVNKHQTRACKCWRPPAGCQLHRLLWQVTIILLVDRKNAALPICLLYCLNLSVFTTITGSHCVTHVENVS